MSGATTRSNAAVIVAGGSGKRFGKDNKLLAEIAGVPVFIRSTLPFLKTCKGLIVIVVPAKLRADFERISSEHFSPGAVLFSNGGKLREDSVRSGLDALRNSNPDFVAIHDAARPMVTERTVAEAFAFAQENGSAVVSAKLTDTVKLADTHGRIERTLDRAFLWAAQTPQIFRYSEISFAYGRAAGKRKPFTDDASAMEAAGFRAVVFPGEPANIKITYSSDIRTAEALLADCPRDRILPRRSAIRG